MNPSLFVVSLSIALSAWTVIFLPDDMLEFLKLKHISNDYRTLLIVVALAGTYTCVGLVLYQLHFAYKYPSYLPSRKFSRWVLKLAIKVKRLQARVTNLEPERAEKELNTCEAWLIRLRDHARLHDIIPDERDQDLLAEIQIGLRRIKNNIGKKQSGKWRKVIGLILTTLTILADLIANLSPTAAKLLLKATTVYYLLSDRDHEFLGPGKD